MIKIMTWKGFGESIIFYTIAVVVFFHGIQLVEKYNKVITWYWTLAIIVGALLVATGVYCLVSRNMRSISWLGIVFVRIVIWPVYLLGEGYHDNEENIPGVAFILTVGILLPIIMLSMWKCGGTSIGVLLNWSNSIFYGAMWYLLTGFIGNFLVKISTGYGFINFPKISDFDGEKDDY
jgi:hypothetical protein